MTDGAFARLRYPPKKWNLLHKFQGFDTQKIAMGIRWKSWSLPSSGYMELWTPSKVTAPMGIPSPVGGGELLEINSPDDIEFRAERHGETFLEQKTDLEKMGRHGDICWSNDLILDVVLSIFHQGWKIQGSSYHKDIAAAFGFEPRVLFKFVPGICKQQILNEKHYYAYYRCSIMIFQACVETSYEVILHKILNKNYETRNHFGVSRRGNSKFQKPNSKQITKNIRLVLSANGFSRLSKMG